MDRALILFGLLAVALGAGFAPAREWDPKQYPISFWCGPPDPFITVERYREIADAGFNYIMPPCEGPATPERNRRILDTARKAGLKAFIQDGRMPLAVTGVANAKQNLDAIVADFAKHPALAGYFITDEPSANAFAGLGEVVAYLREKDPKHVAYINLLPNYANQEQLGTPTYEAHVQKYIEVVKPFAVSYDHYHFTRGGDRPGFFANLEVVRRLSIQADLPFWQIVLLIPHLGYRQLTEAELRWEAMQTLAYGAKGLMYFTYWTPPGEGDWEPAVADREGRLTQHHAHMKRINADVKAYGAYILDAVPSGVYLAGAPAPEVLPRIPGTPVRVEKGDVTVGLFRRDTHLYVLLANRNYKQATEAEALLTTAGKAVSRLDTATGKWQPAGATAAPEGEAKVALTLPAGDAVMLRW